VKYKADHFTLMQQLSNLADVKKQSGAASSSTSLSFKQTKRNELCELLRLELQSAQEEVIEKTELIITLKR
jgi:hypothetical protein